MPPDTYFLAVADLAEPADRVFARRTTGDDHKQEGHRPRARSVGAMFDLSAAAMNPGDRRKPALVRSAARIVIGPPYLVNSLLPRVRPGVKPTVRRWGQGFSPTELEAGRPAASAVRTRSRRRTMNRTLWRVARR